MKYLLKLNVCYADEFMIDGAYVIDEDEYKRFKTAVEEFTEADFCFGTNEWISFYSGDQLEKAYEVMEISSKEHAILAGLGMDRIGFAANFYDFVVDYEEEEE